MKIVINEELDWEEEQDKNDIETIKKNVKYLDEILPIAIKFIKKTFSKTLEDVEIYKHDYYYMVLDYSTEAYELTFEFNDILKNEEEFYYHEIIDILRNIFGIDYSEYTMPINIYVQAVD